MRPSIVLGSVFTAVVLLSGAFQVVVFGVPWLGDRVTEEKTYARAISRLVVDAESSDVRVLAGSGEGVRVTRKLRWHSDRPQSQEAWAGDTLTIRPGECSGRGLCEIDYTIEVPAGTDVDLTTSSGDIHTKSLTGPQTITASSGDIDVRPAAPSTVDARSSSGDIEILLPPGEYAVVADANSGDVSVDVKRDDDSPHKVTARASSGDIDISSR